MSVLVYKERKSTKISLYIEYLCNEFNTNKISLYALYI